MLGSICFCFCFFLYMYKSCFAAGIIGLLRCMCQGSWVGESLGSIRTYKTTIFHTSRAKRLIQSVCVCVFCDDVYVWVCVWVCVIYPITVKLLALHTRHKSCYRIVKYSIKLREICSFVSDGYVDTRIHGYLRPVASLSHDTTTTTTTTTFHCGNLCAICVFAAGRNSRICQIQNKNQIQKNK